MYLSLSIEIGGDWLFFGMKLFNNANNNVIFREHNEFFGELRENFKYWNH